MPRRSAADLDTLPVRLVEAPVIPAELPPPPTHLSEAMQTWWQAVVRDYGLGPHHLHLLECAADAWDRMVQARDTLRVPCLVAGTKHRHPFFTPTHGPCGSFNRPPAVFSRMRAPLRRVSLAPGQCLTAASKIAWARTRSFTPARCW